MLFSLSLEPKTKPQHEQRKENYNCRKGLPPTLVSIPAASRVDFCTLGMSGYLCFPSRGLTDPTEAEEADTTGRQSSAVALRK